MMMIRVVIVCMFHPLASSFLTHQQNSCTTLCTTLCTTCSKSDGNKYKSIVNSIPPHQFSSRRRRQARSQIIQNSPLTSRQSSILYQYNPNETDIDTNSNNCLVDASISPSPFDNEDEEARPYVELIHKETNTTIVLLGCLHGSPSSSNDVKSILNRQPTDVVILELCPTRYKDLIKYCMSSKKKLNESNDPRGGNEFIQMVSKTIQTRGISTGVAAGILGGASSISSSLSGFETGLEFLTAIDYVQAKKTQKGTATATTSAMSSNCDIILGDRFVDETLKGVGSIPSLSFNMWNDFIQQKCNWDRTYGVDANVISTAIFGDERLKQTGKQIDMRKVLTRNEDVKNDLVRLILPTFVLTQSAVLLFNGSLFALVDIMDSSSSSLSSISDLGMHLDVYFLMTETDLRNLFVELLIEVVTSSIILLVGYVTLALPAVRVILTERDVQLTEAVVSACKVATEKHYCNEDNEDDRSTKRTRRVVAILGLLHVNGIAKKLIE